MVFGAALVVCILVLFPPENRVLISFCLFRSSAVIVGAIGLDFDGGVDFCGYG
jgi:hypothetical protein